MVEAERYRSINHHIVTCRDGRCHDFDTVDVECRSSFIEIDWETGIHPDLSQLVLFAINSDDNLIRVKWWRISREVIFANRGLRNRSITTGVYFESAASVEADRTDWMCVFFVQLHPLEYNQCIAHQDWRANESIRQSRWAQRWRGWDRDEWLFRLCSSVDRQSIQDEQTPKHCAAERRKEKTRHVDS